MATARFAVGGRRGWLLLAMALALCLQLLFLSPGARVSAFLLPPLGAGGHLTQQHLGPMRGRCVAAPSSFLLSPPRSQPAHLKASIDLNSRGGGGEVTGGGGARPGGGIRNSQGRARSAFTVGRWVRGWVGVAWVNDAAGLGCALPLLRPEGPVAFRGRFIASHRSCERTNPCRALTIFLYPPHVDCPMHGRRPASRACKAWT